MASRIGVRGIAGITLAGVVGVNELLGVMGRANLLDRILSHAFGWQVTPTFNLLVLVFGLALILAELLRRDTPAAKGSKVKPRLVACETRSIVIKPTDVNMSPGGPQDALLAAMAAFEYDPDLPTGPRVTVRASLSFEQEGHRYQGGGKTTTVGSGYWRDATRNQAIFSPGVRHELIVAIEHRGAVNGLQDERADRSDIHPTCPPLGVWPIVSGHTVSIELILMDESTHQRLATNVFQYRLSISDVQLELTLLSEP
jgi:hypothetical protein